MSAASAPARTAPVHTRTSSSVVPWALLYVGAWIVGLVVAPPAPALGAPATEVHAYYVAHGGRAAIQSLMVHGVAGLALGTVVILLTRGTHATSVAMKIARSAGVAAVTLSLLQVGVLQLLVMLIDGAAPERAVQFVHTINLLDSAKLVGLGAFIAAFSSAAAKVELLPRWLVRAGLVVAVLLPVSGAGFVFSSTSLSVLLYASLPLLLAWVLTAAVAARRSTAA